MLSTTPNKQIMEQARYSLKGAWGLGVAITATFFVIRVLLELIPVIGPFTSLFISGAFTLGFTTIYLNLVQQQDAEFAQIFSGFSDYVRSFLAFLLMNIFIVLWTLLLIIPGIIATFSYMLTFYVLSDDASLTAMEAIKRSKEMMRGNKWKAFCLSVRFSGWMLLSILTLGIGLLWLIPYMGVSFAKFYEDIKQNEIDVQLGITAKPAAKAKTQHDRETESILNNIRAKNVQMKLQK